MEHHEYDEQDDPIARRLRRATAQATPRVPDDLVRRTLATVRRDTVQRRQWWNRVQTWKPLLAASLVAALTAALVVNLVPVRAASSAPDMTATTPWSPWQILEEDMPLNQEWRSLQKDADRAAQVLVACLPGMRSTGQAPRAGLSE